MGDVIGGHVANGPVSQVAFSPQANLLVAVVGSHVYVSGPEPGSTSNARRVILHDFEPFGDAGVPACISFFGRHQVRLFVGGKLGFS